MTPREELADKVSAWILCRVWGHEWREYYRVTSVVMAYNNKSLGEPSKQTWTQCIRCNKRDTKP